MAAKEKTNLLEVIPCRSEHITAEREGASDIFGGTRYGCMGTDRWEMYGT